MTAPSVCIMLSCRLEVHAEEATDNSIKNNNDKWEQRVFHDEILDNQKISVASCIDRDIEVITKREREMHTSK